MATNHTQNYNLNLWEPTDRFLRTEFNENTQKIDDALVGHDAALANLTNAKADASAVTALTQTVNGKATTAALNAEAAARTAKDTALDAAVSAAQAKAEEAHVYVGSYVGDGMLNRVITLPWAPMYMVLFGYSSEEPTIFFMVQGGASSITRSYVTSSFEDTYAPRLQGASITFKMSSVGNTNQKAVKYIMFR